MEAALRPHRGKMVLALGVLSIAAPLACVLLGLMYPPGGELFFPSILVALPLGIAAFVLGTRQLAGMRDHRIEPSGRSLVRTGRILGPLGAVGWAGFTAWVLVIFARSFGNDYISMVDGPEGTRHVTAHHLGLIADEWQEIRKPDGSWVKDGPAIIRFTANGGRKIEEGSYREGKRDGPWIMWNPDGSIDQKRSGVYQNDVRIGPSPTGDYPVRPHDGSSR